MFEEIFIILILAVIFFGAFSALFIFITLPFITFCDLLTSGDRLKYEDLEHEKPKHKNKKSLNANL